VSVWGHPERTGKRLMRKTSFVRGVKKV